MSPFAFAAEAFRGNIVVAPKIWLVPSSITPFTPHFEGAGSIPPKSVLVVRGLPATMTFTEGRRFGPDVWLVPLDGVSRLQVQAPAEAGHADLSLALVTLEGTLLAEAKVTVYVAPGNSPGDRVLTGTAPQHQLPEAERGAAIKLMEKGDEHIKAGNVQIAREFYKRAANQGLAEAAMALGATFDPDELARMPEVVGVQPDRAAAKKWYEKAQELGSQEAAARLRRN